MKFEGIYTPIITPYHADFTCNKDALAQLIEHLIEAGVHGLVVAGTTGEYYAQTKTERLEAMKFCIDLVKNRVPVVVGTGAIRTEDSIEYALAARKAGGDALLVATPPYACPNGHEIAAHALAIDHAADLPIMLYNYPGRMSSNMDETMLKALKGSPNFCAIKESTGDINRLHMLACAYPDIKLSCGMDNQALEFFAWGAQSWVCAGSNFAPEAHLALYDACVIKGDFNKGRAIMAAMLPLMDVLEEGGKFVQSIKYGVTLQAIDAGSPRKPLLPLDQADKAQLGEIITTMNQTIEAL